MHRISLILLASHSTADIAQACDIVYEFQEGKLVERATSFRAGDYKSPLQCYVFIDL